jgi:glycosyltransferase involved in cell wall biosynthesis
MINTLHVIVTVFNRGANLRVLLDSFLVQTNSQWQIHIIHDGAAPQPIRDIVSSYRDPRIQYFETPQVNGSWGHPNRNIALRQLALNHRDYVLMTNDDNYYVPKFIEYFMKECRREDTGFVYCNTLHSYMNYGILDTEVRENLIDMGSFVVKLDVAKHVGFNHINFSADGLYAMECANYCKVRRLRIIKIPKVLFVHN